MRGIGRRLSEVKSLRAFAFEVLVVVVGVLIALGANELVSRWSWQQRIAKGEELLSAEAADTSVILMEQAITTPCVVAQIDRIEAQLRGPGAWRGIATMPTVIGPAVIRSPSRHLSDSAWRSLISDGTAAQLPTQRAQATAMFYTQQQTLQHLTGITEELRARLDFLARPLTLGDETRASLLQSLAELRWFTQRQGMMASQMLSAMDTLGRLPDRAQIARDLDAMAPTSTIPQCRSAGLPLATIDEVLPSLTPPASAAR